MEIKSALVKKKVIGTANVNVTFLILMQDGDGTVAKKSGSMGTPFIFFPAIVNNSILICLCTFVY